MKLGAALRLPSALAATSVKTVIAAASLVGITTAATAGVIMLGSNAIVSPKTPPAAAGRFFDASPVPGGNTVIVVPKPTVQQHVAPPTPKVAPVPTPAVPSIVASPTVIATLPTASRESVRVPVPVADAGRRARCRHCAARGDTNTNTNTDSARDAHRDTAPGCDTAAGVANTNSAANR